MPRHVAMRLRTRHSAAAAHAGAAAQTHAPRVVAPRAHAARSVRVRAAPQPGGGGTAVQRYTYGKVDVEMPLAAVQQMPTPAQAAVVASIFGALGLCTWASCTVVGPALESAAPGFVAFSRATWPLLGATFVAAGVAHFTAHDEFCTMYPTRCG